MRRAVPSLLVLGALGVLALGCTGKYVRATTNERVASTPERVARGQYLVNQVMACGTCHTPRERDWPRGGERADLALAGNVVGLPSQGIKLWVPNLTPDVETGLGGWSDDEIGRAIRDGVGKDGRLLFPLMPFTSYQHVSDEDLRAIVAYLRTVPRVRRAPTLAKNEVGLVGSFLVNRGVMHHRPARDVRAPRPADTLAYGQYVLRLGHCGECHAATSTGPHDAGDEGFLSGWDQAQVTPGIGKVYFRNLTPDRQTGLGAYTTAEIKAALRAGKRLDGKPMAAPMSLFTPHLSGLSEADVDALVAYLKSVPPYANTIPERALVPAYEKSLRAR